MKARTIIVAGSFARIIGATVGLGLLALAICETISALCCCVQSERED